MAVALMGGPLLRTPDTGSLMLAVPPRYFATPASVTLAVAPTAGRPKPAGGRSGGSGLCEYVGG